MWSVVNEFRNILMEDINVWCYVYLLYMLKEVIMNDELKDNLRVIFFVIKCGVGKINLMIWFIGFFGL